MLTFAKINQLKVICRGVGFVLRYVRDLRRLPIDVDIVYHILI